MSGVSCETCHAPATDWCPACHRVMCDGCGDRHHGSFDRSCTDDPPACGGRGTTEPADDDLRERVASIINERIELFGTPWWACAYFRRGEPNADPNGTCSFGCRDEPACKTGAPRDGWDGDRIEWEDNWRMVDEIIAAVREGTSP